MTQKMRGMQGEKISIYMSEEMRADLENEAARQGRSMSWIIRQAWLLARPRLMEQSAVPEASEP